MTDYHIGVEQKIINWLIKITSSRDFPGGTVVKNLPVNAGDTSLITGPGRPHMLRSN